MRGGPGVENSPPWGELIERPGHLEGIRPPHPVPNHLHVAVDAVDPERDAIAQAMATNAVPNLSTHTSNVADGNVDTLARPG